MLGQHRGSLKYELEGSAKVGYTLRRRRISELSRSQWKVKMFLWPRNSSSNPPDGRR